MIEMALIVAERLSLFLYISAQNVSPGSTSKVRITSALGDTFSGGTYGHVLVWDSSMKTLT